MKVLNWPLQEQADDTPPSGGGEVTKPQFVAAKLDERYKPAEVRELLARYGDKAEVALENYVKQTNDMVQRLMKRQAETEYDLEAAHTKTQASADRIKAIEAERDEARKQLGEIDAKAKAGTIDDLLTEKFNGDKTLIRRHRAYLALEGYALDVDGEGDKARLMLVNGDSRHNFNTVVNDAFYTRYDDAKPSGDTPLGVEAPPKASGQSTFDPVAAAKLLSEQQKARRSITELPKGN